MVVAGFFAQCRSLEDTWEIRFSGSYYRPCGHGINWLSNRHFTVYRIPSSLIFIYAECHQTDAAI